tara:strand:+ start:168 stop:491 length:324 start_codon:yes stop_codon:yes gene_type:complete
MKPELIKQARQAQGWSQQELAEKVGAPHSSVYKWERGMSKPSKSNQKRLEEVFSGSDSGAGNASVEKHLRQRIVDLEARLEDKDKNIALLEDALAIAKSALKEIAKS